MLDHARQEDGHAGHRVELDTDILAVLPRCDLLITDVSSVGLDFLYLRREQPVLITDRHNDRVRMHDTVPLSRCADVIDESTIGNLTTLLVTRMTHDEHRAKRAEMCRYYFGDLAPGDSTTRFMSAIEEILATWDRMLGRTNTRNGKADLTAVLPELVGPPTAHSRRSLE